MLERQTLIVLPELCSPFRAALCAILEWKTGVGITCESDWGSVGMLNSNGWRIGAASGADRSLVGASSTVVWAYKQGENITRGPRHLS